MLELLHQLAALEDTFTVNVETPFASWTTIFSGVLGRLREHAGIRLRLVKVPVKSSPKHHGNLPGRRGSREEVRVGLVGGRV